MSEHPNAAALRRMNDTVAAGNWDAMSDMLADDVVWHEIGNPEPVRGKEALKARWAAMGDAGGTISIDLHDVVANDDHGVALVTATVSGGGQSFTYRTAEIYHLRDGKITERWAFSDDTAAINAFFGGR
jgi:ketosteroid isomerase-like protein